jgi:hypothetical protein
MSGAMTTRQLDDDDSALARRALAERELALRDAEIEIRTPPRIIGLGLGACIRNFLLAMAFEFLVLFR